MIYDDIRTRVLSLISDLCGISQWRAFCNENVHGMKLSKSVVAEREKNQTFFCAPPHIRSLHLLTSTQFACMCACVSSLASVKAFFRASKNYSD